MRYYGCMSNQGFRPRPVADLTPENLKILIDDMGTGPGWYTSHDLFTWYEAMCKEGGLIPVTRRAFGNALKGLGYKNSVRRYGNKPARCWYITRRAERALASPGAVS